MSALDIAGWVAAGVTLVAAIVIGAGAVRTGRALLLASLLGGLAVLIADDRSPWLGAAYGLLIGWTAYLLGRDLRKNGAGS